MENISLPENYHIIEIMAKSSGGLRGGNATGVKPRSSGATARQENQRRFYNGNAAYNTWSSINNAIEKERSMSGNILESGSDRALEKYENRVTMLSSLSDSARQLYKRFSDGTDTAKDIKELKSIQDTFAQYKKSPKNFG